MVDRRAGRSSAGSQLSDSRTLRRVTLVQESMSAPRTTTRPRTNVTRLDTVPISRRHRRRSFWQRSLDEARAVGDWYRIPKLYTKKTAQQIASDVRCAHLRPTSVHRVRGFAPGEVWESKWIPSSVGAPGDCEVWVRFLGEKFSLAEAD